MGYFKERIPLLLPEAMLMKWLLCAATLNFLPVYVFSKDVSRNKRSDDFIPCERGWYFFRGKCYKVEGKKRSGRIPRDRAAESCKKAGGNLVSILSQEELEFIISFLLLDVRAPVWIGLHDRVTESEYYWDDGSVVNYTNWRELEPSGPKNENEDCVEMDFDPQRNFIGQWNDIACNSARAYICQMKINKKKKFPDPRYCSSEGGGVWKFQNSCYYVVTELKSWKNAEQHCKDNFNGHLITILDMTVDLFLDYILSNMKKEFWIGIKIQNQLQQKWTSGWHVSYNGMNKEHEDFIEGTCVVRNERHQWTMVPCSKKYSFICETTKVRPPILKLPVKGSHCPEKPDGWRDLDGEFCYYIDTENSVSWYEANFNCKRRGGDLLSLHSKEETDILHPFVKYTQIVIFIGLFRLLEDEEIFIWSDGSIKDYENWAHDEPNDMLQEKCVEMTTSDMKWNDAACEFKRGYVCSVKKIALNTTADDIETTDCTGYVTVKALIGVSICVLLVVILLGILVYYFRPCDVERRKSSTAVPVPPPSPTTNRPKYRLTAEMIVKDDDDQYEMMR